MNTKECSAISPNIRYTKGSLLTMSLSHRNYVTFSIFPRWEQFIPTLGIIIRLSISRVCCASFYIICNELLRQ